MLRVSQHPSMWCAASHATAGHSISQDAATDRSELLRRLDTRRLRLRWGSARGRWWSAVPVQVPWRFHPRYPEADGGHALKVDPDDASAVLSLDKLVQERAQAGNPGLGKSGEARDAWVPKGCAPTKSFCKYKLCMCLIPGAQVRGGRRLKTLRPTG